MKRNFKPDPYKRKEIRERKRLEQLQKSMTEVSKLNLPIKFYCLGFRFPSPEDTTTHFIVTLGKPVKWRDVILRVSQALSDLL